MAQEYQYQPDLPSYAAPEPPKRNTNRTILIIVAVVLVLCCCCVAFILLMYFYLGDMLLDALSTPTGLLPLLQQIM